MGHVWKKWSKREKKHRHHPCRKTPLAFEGFCHKTRLPFKCHYNFNEPSQLSGSMMSNLSS